MHCIASSPMRSMLSRRMRHRPMRSKTRASTRFVKWSRCFLHSGVIGMSCTSIRDGTLSIAPSLTWRAQWRNVRRQRRRKPQRRRSALRSGSRHAPFSSHVTEPAASGRAITSCRTSPASRNDGGRRRDDIKSLRRPRSVWSSVCLSPAVFGSYHPAFAFMRVLHALQYFGQVMVFSTVPALRASRHSAPHCF